MDSYDTYQLYLSELGKKQSGICTHTLGKIVYLQFQGQKRLLLSLGPLLKGNDLKSMKKFFKLTKVYNSGGGRKLVPPHSCHEVLRGNEGRRK